LSQVNPDDFASRFGYHAARGDFEAGLETLLDGDRWRAYGESAYEYVCATHALDVVIEKHLEAYRSLLQIRRQRPSGRPMACPPNRRRGCQAVVIGDSFTS
jgi:hypothetical protein